MAGNKRGLNARLRSATIQPKGLPPPPAKPRASMRKRCNQIRTKLKKDRRSIWFNAPVEVERLGLHDYHNVIKDPRAPWTRRTSLPGGTPRTTPSPPTSGSRSPTRCGTTLLGTRSTPLPAASSHHFDQKMYNVVVSWFEQECKRLGPLSVEKYRKY